MCVRMSETVKWSYTRHFGGAQRTECDSQALNIKLLALFEFVFDFALTVTVPLYSSGLA